jgi:hypothetical protein
MANRVTPSSIIYSDEYTGGVIGVRVTMIDGPY